MTFPENFNFPGFPGFPDPVGTLDLVSRASKVQTLHLAEEANLSHFGSKSLLSARALPRSNNKHVYRQS